MWSIVTDEVDAYFVVEGVHSSSLLNRLKIINPSERTIQMKISFDIVIHTLETTMGASSSV